MRLLVSASKASNAFFSIVNTSICIVGLMLIGCKGNRIAAKDASSLSNLHRMSHEIGDFDAKVKFIFITVISP